MEQDIFVPPTDLVAPGVVEINCSGAGAVMVDLTSSSTPTGFSYVIEGTGNGTDWFAVGAVDPSQGPGFVVRGLQTAVTGTWVVPAGGLQQLRFNLQAITGGTAIISLNAGAGVGATYIAGGVISLLQSFVSLTPSATGGLATKTVIVPNNTTNIIVKTAPGQLYGMRWSNNGNTWAYVKLYNAVTATAGVGTPFDRVAIPPGCNRWEDPNGIAYGTGITAIVTTGIADLDTTAPAANEYLISFDYK